MNTNSKTEEEQQRITISQSMKEVGVFRYFIGGFVILVGGLFVFIEIFIVGICLLLIGLLLIGWCSETIIDNNKKILIHKSGLFTPFILMGKKSIEGATAVRFKTITSKHKGFGQKMSSTSTSYKIGLELPSGLIKVDILDDKKKANFYSGEIAKLLNIELKQNDQ